MAVKVRILVFSQNSPTLL